MAETGEPGDWSHPDAGVEPEDYVEGDGTEEPDRGAEAGAEGVEPSEPADSMSPGQSLDEGGETIEPNEPA